jgi:hypothetical protein
VTLLAALHGEDARQLTVVQWPTDRGFRDRRIRLARTIVGWLKQRCVSETCCLQSGSVAVLESF